jgi:thiamine pyrophosphokinase
MPIETSARGAERPEPVERPGDGSEVRNDEPTVVVVTGGEAPERDVATRLLAAVPDGAVVVAADSGVEHALALGLVVDHAIGDFDSVDPAVLASVEAGGAAVQRHPEDKDATDLELALDLAEHIGARRVLVLGGHGGRLDHFLANVAVLAAPRYANLVVDAVMGSAVVHVARPWAPSVVRGVPGDIVTLLPVHGPAEGVVTDGLAFALDRYTLVEGTTRGVSNALLGERAEIRLTAGCLLVVHPGPDGAAAPGRPPHSPPPTSPRPSHDPGGPS